MSERTNWWDIIKQSKWWALAFVAVIAIIVAACIGNMTQQSRDDKNSSVQQLSSSDSKKITKLIKDFTIDCGKWGTDTSKITEENAGEYYSSLSPYEAGNSSSLPDGDAGIALSRGSSRSSCIAKYISSDSNLSASASTRTAADVMSSYTSEPDTIEVSDPQKSKVVINANARTALSVKASWKSNEVVMFPYFDKFSDEGEIDGMTYDISVGKGTTFKSKQREIELKDVSIQVENVDGKWKIASIGGGNWDEYGYTNSVSTKTDPSDGAKRIIMSSSEQYAPLPKK